MVTIEQVELLESKVSRAIEYVKRLTADNERLKAVSSQYESENSVLHSKLDLYQKRIAELEDLLLGFKKDQERIEQGIISALDRLNHFEDAVDAVSDSGAASGSNAALDFDTASVDDAATDDGAVPSNGGEIAFNTPSVGDAVSDGGVVSGSNAALDFGMSSVDDTAAEDEAPVALPVTRPANAALSFPLEREASASDGYRETDELEDSDEMDGFDEDEFLDVLKSGRFSVPEPVAAFSQELLAEGVRLKTVNGPELDIF